MRSIIASEVPPVGKKPLTSQSSDEEVDARVRDSALTIHHPAGTAAMGKVVDSPYRPLALPPVRHGGDRARAWPGRTNAAVGFGAHPAMRLMRPTAQHVRTRLLRATTRVFEVLCNSVAEENVDEGSTESNCARVAVTAYCVTSAGLSLI